MKGSSLCSSSYKMTNIRLFAWFFNTVKQKNNSPITYCGLMKSLCPSWSNVKPLVGLRRAKQDVPASFFKVKLLLVVDARALAVSVWLRLNPLEQRTGERISVRVQALSHSSRHQEQMHTLLLLKTLRIFRDAFQFFLLLTDIYSIHSIFPKHTMCNHFNFEVFHGERAKRVLYEFGLKYRRWG